MKKYALLIVALFVTNAAFAKDLPPKLGSEQVIFLTYKLAGETPPFDEWADADGKRSAYEIERLYNITAKRTDLAQFHRDLELALYGYDEKTGRAPLGEIKAGFLSSPLVDVAGVEVHIDNADDFAYWNLSSQKYQEIVKSNNGNARYNFVSSLTVKGVNKTKPRNKDNKYVLNLHWDKLYIYTKDKEVLLDTIE